MKKLLMFLLIFLSFGNFVSASVIVHNYTLTDSYSPFQKITGKINLTISGEKYDDKITSNDNDERQLGKFLTDNGAIFKCSPPDCSKKYLTSSGSNSKDIKVLALKKYVGFVLTGKHIIVKGINFSIKSNFEEGSKIPLKIKFFEKKDWAFTNFSNSLLDKNWGCYNKNIGSAGPLIGDSLYCEMIPIGNSKFLKVGAQVGGNDNAKLTMMVFPETGTGASWKCSFDPNSEDGCTINPDISETFPAGNYQVCVEADKLTNYKIYQENSGKNCGFAYDEGPINSTKDFGIFAQSTKYADAISLRIDTNDKSIIAAANNIIAEKYGGDCSDGCVLPIALSGTTQDVTISNVKITYTNNYEWNSDNKIYNLSIVPATVNFSGILDLGLLGFSVSKSMNYTLLINGIELLSKKIHILPSPTISLVAPLNPPAGVPINFYSKIDFAGNKTLNYEWDFGDNVSKTTNIPFALHTYANLGNYTLSLKVSAGGNLTSSRTFKIRTIDPELAINITLKNKKSAMGEIVSTINKLQPWYREIFSKAVNIDLIQSDLKSIEKEKNTSYSEQEFVKVAKKLYALNIPIKINTEILESNDIVTKLSDINIEPIATIGGGVTGATNDKYAKQIFNWQLDNIASHYSTREFSASYWDGETKGLFRTYKFYIMSKYPDESYFVINRPFSDLYFKGNVRAKKVGKYTVIPIDGNSNTSFEFYYKNTDMTSFFISPRLGAIVVKADIDTTCNFNHICEKQYGENSDNCRSDCKPVAQAVTYVILSILFLLLIYTILQIWYKHRYENYLFNDRRQLYNLLMYVTNARARGMDDSRIASDLKKQGWSSERINYIIKKSNGERTGLYEIIPIEKIAAYFRNKKARKIQSNMSNIATNVR